jgi:type VI secretion system protein ImpC
LKVFVFNISKEELINQLKSVENLSDSFFYSLLINKTHESSADNSFAIIGGNYSFGLNVEDVALLIRIAKLANSVNAPFISYIRPEIFGYKDFSENADSLQLHILENSNEAKLWTALRSLPEAQYIALSPMRVLLRLPFGKASDSTETFSFEEFTDKISHDEYLWMNPCVAIVLSLAQSYRRNGWQMGNFIYGDVENLPMYFYSDDGETKTKPCAETVLTENMLETLLNQGFIPLASFKDSDKIRCIGLQSISVMKTTLAGKWKN